MVKNTAFGWIIFAGAMGMFCTMVATDVGQLQSWQSAWNPPFVAKLIGYFGAVLSAFAAGRIMPTTGDTK